MAPRKDKAPPSTFLGPRKMTRAMLKKMGDHRVITLGATKIPPKTEVYAKPEGDEVIVFKDFFSASLRFPLDLAVVDIFARYGVFLH